MTDLALTSVGYGGFLSTWFTLDLGDALLAAESLHHIEQRFVNDFNDAGKPADMAIFIRHQSSGSVHCSVRLYFSPASATLAQALGAVACEQPSNQDLGLLAGIEQAWPRLFAGHTQ